MQVLVICDKKDCTRDAHWEVTHFNHPDSRTVACTPHSQWWIVDADGIRTGTRTQLRRSSDA